jgi:hypothetical protein
MHNRTRPVVPGAYWTMTGHCLHRVLSCDHRVRSSREKQISPFLIVCSDLVSFSFVSIRRRPYPSRTRRDPERRLLAEPPCHRIRAPLACCPHHRRMLLLAARTATACSCSLLAPSPRALARCLHRRRAPVLAARVPPQLSLCQSRSARHRTRALPPRARALCRARATAPRSVPATAKT